ncbi:hypothetical protein SUSAZ_05840 [Sulfolobus acidocaldarius SUSAZ]|nr:hypothetical protein SUSAZ_05840 [Sulfolobus acidocaldarius SUSAZ]
MNCDKEALRIIDIIFNSNLIYGKVVYEDELKRLIGNEKKLLCSERELIQAVKVYLRSLGIVVIKGGNYSGKKLKVFDDGTFLSEEIYGVEYDIIDERGYINDRIVLYNDRTVVKVGENEMEYKINKNEVIKTLISLATQSSTRDEFITKLLKFLNDNNDVRTIQWLKDFIVSNKHV